MPEPPSTRFQMVGPTGTTDPINLGDDAIRALIAQLEARAAMYQVGLAAARPEAGAANVGMTYHATDTGVAYISTGATWRVQGGYLGQLSFSAANFAPDGFLVCAGQPISANNQELREWLVARGNPWGTSGGLPLAPPAQSRSPMASGAASGGLSARTHGQLIGEERHTLTVAEMPPHTHKLPQPDRTTADVSNNNAPTWRGSAGGPPDVFTESAGIGDPHNVTHPSIVLTLLIQAR